MSAIVLLTLCTLMGLPPDVPSDYPGRADLELLDSYGALHTFPDGAFRGARPASRYEMAMMIAPLIRQFEPLELKLGKRVIPPDVPDTEPARDALGQLSSNGLLQVYSDTLYRGVRPASRYEAAYSCYLLLTRSVRVPSSEVEAAVVKEKDGKIGPAVGIADDVLLKSLKTLAAAKALVPQADGNFNGNVPVTRYELAGMLAATCRAIKK